VTGQWAQLKEALEAPSAERVLDWVRAADEKQRRAAFTEVVAHGRRTSGWRDWREWQRRQGAYVVALAGCASTAKKAATALSRGDLRWVDTSAEHGRLLAALRSRAVPWLGELAHAMAERMPAEGGHWALVDALVRESGCTPPTNEQFVGGWIDHVRESSDPDAALRDGPYPARLLPALFTHDRLGSRLDYTYGNRGFLPALVRLGQDDLRCGCGCSTGAAPGCCAAGGPASCARTPGCTTSSRPRRRRWRRAPPTTCGWSRPATPPWRAWPSGRCAPPTRPGCWAGTPCATSPGWRWPGRRRPW
jgi:hypothetical protein